MLFILDGFYYTFNSPREINEFVTFMGIQWSIYGHEMEVINAEVGMLNVEGVIWPGSAFMKYRIGNILIYANYRKLVRTDYM